MDHRGGKGGAGKGQVVALRQLRHPFLGHPAVQQPGEKEAAQQGEALLIPLPQLLGVPALRPLRVQLAVEPLQHGGELRGVDGLEDILRDIHLNGLLGVLEIVKAGKDHEFGRRQPLRQDAAQLQAVHKGHLDVREHHVGL